MKGKEIIERLKQQDITTEFFAETLAPYFVNGLHRIREEFAWIGSIIKVSINKYEGGAIRRTYKCEVFYLVEHQLYLEIQANLVPGERLHKKWVYNEEYACVEPVESKLRHEHELIEYRLVAEHK